MGSGRSGIQVDGGAGGVAEELQNDDEKMRYWRRRRRRSGGGGGGEGEGGGPCGACKFLRRKCMRGCVFAPYFGADEEGREGFSAVHKVFGASNVGKLLQRIGPHPDHRRHALITMQYQAHARLLDPIYGCLRTIFALQRQVQSLQAELEYVRTQLSSHQLLTKTGSPYLLDQKRRRQNMSKLSSSTILNLSSSSNASTTTSGTVNCGPAMHDGESPWCIHQHYEPNYHMVPFCTSTAGGSAMDHWSIDIDGSSQQLQASIGTILAEDINNISTHQRSILEMIKGNNLTKLQNSPTDQSYNMSNIKRIDLHDPLINNHHMQSPHHHVLQLIGDANDQEFQHPLFSDASDMFIPDSYVQKFNSTFETQDLQIAAHNRSTDMT